MPTGDTLAGPVQDVEGFDAQAKVILSAGMAVYISAALQVLKASASADATATVIGLASAAAALDATVMIRTDGVFFLADWTLAAGTATLTVGADYFLSATAGLLTTTPPVTGSVVLIGRAVSTTRLQLTIDTPVKLAV